MCSIEQFRIDLKALPQGVSTYQYRLNDEYFKAIDAPDVERGELSCCLSVDERKTFSNSIFIQKE